MAKYNEIMDKVRQKRFEQDVAKVDDEYLRRFSESAGSYLDSAKSQYDGLGYGNAYQSYLNRRDSYNDLDYRRRVIQEWSKRNPGALDQQGTAFLDSFGKDSKGILDAFSGMRNYFSQFDSEDSYNQYLADAERWSKLTDGYDPTANAREGKAGWQKYQADKAGAPKQEDVSEDPRYWWRQLGSYGIGTPDTALSQLNTQQVAQLYREVDAAMAGPDSRWTQEQQETFGYLYSRDQKKAENYARAINEKLNAQQEQEQRDAIKGKATSGFGAGLVHTAGAILAGATGLADFQGDLIRKGAVGYIPTADGYVTPFEYSQEVTGGIAQNLNEKYGTLREDIPVIGGKGLGDVYGLGVSATQSMAYGMTMGQIPTLITFFGSGAASAVDEAKARGASDEQALTFGAISGAAEVLTEMVPLDNLLNMGRAADLKGLFWDIFKQGGEEFLGEGANSIITSIADYFTFGEMSTYNMAKKEYMEQGMDEKEAGKRAFLDIVGDIVFDALGGFATGSTSAGIAAGIPTAVHNARVKRNYGQFQQELVAEGLESADGTESHDLAAKYQLRLDQGKKLTGGQLSRLIDANEQAFRAEEKVAQEAQSAAVGEEAESDESGREEAELPFTMEEEASKAAPKATVLENRTASKTEAVADNMKATAEESTEVDDEPAAVTLEEAAKGYGDQAQAMIHTYQAGQDVAKFDAAYRAAYDMGRSGVSLGYTMKSGSAAYLNENQRKLAHAAGVDASGTSAKARAAQIQPNGKTGRKKGAVKGEGVTIADLKKTFNDTQGRAYKILSTVAEATGIDIVLYRSQADENGRFQGAQGKYDRKNNPGTIYIDLNAGLSNVKDTNDLAKYAMVRTFSHEFTHFIENWNPIQYNEFRKAVFQAMEENGQDPTDLIELKMEQNPGMDYDAASREVVAEAMTDILEDSSFIQTLAEEHKTVFQKLLDKLKEFVTELRSYFASIGSNPSREARAVKQQVGDTLKYLESIVKQFDRAAVQAVENYQKTVAEDVAVSEMETATADNATAEVDNATAVLDNSTESEATTEATTGVATPVEEAVADAQAPAQQDAYTDLENRLKQYTHVDIDGIRYSAKAKKEGGYYGNIKRIPAKAGGVPVENARGTIYSSYTPGFATRDEAIADLVAVARNNKLLGAAAVETTKPKEEVTDNGRTENGPVQEAVSEPQRRGAGAARLLEEVDPEAVPGSRAGRQSVRPAADEGTGTAGRDGRADHPAGDAGERGQGDRLAGDLQQLQPVTEETGLTTHAAAKEYAAGKGYRIEINKLAAKKQMVQVDIYDKQNLPTMNPVIIHEASDWNKVKEAIDKREKAEQTKAAADKNVGDKTSPTAEDTNVPGKSDPVKLREIVIDLTEQRSTESPRGGNFVIGDSLGLPNGTKARVRANIDAIRLVKQIAAEGRFATQQEQEVLSKYVGWGGLQDAFGKPTTNFSTRKIEYQAVKGLEAEFEELKTVLTEEEYKSARESTKNAHYTSIEVIKAMYAGLQHLGFTGGRMLEPSSGVGNFVGAMPTDMTSTVKSWTMVELDNITGLFAKYLYPNADMRIQGFEEANIPDGYMDVAIGNVPFGNYAVVDKKYPKAVKSGIHNYFLAKSLDKVRPGGLVMFITSHYTMDSRDNAVRKYIAQRADLLGAIRLPNTAFAGNAGTSVVTDILILKKRADKTAYAGEDFRDVTWQNYSGGGAAVNSYFANHPEMVLGEVALARGMYSAYEMTVNPHKDKGSLGEQIRKAMENIQGRMDYTQQQTPEKANFRQAEARKRRQKLQVKDGIVHTLDETGKLTKLDVDEDTAKRISGMVAIRDAHGALCDGLLQGVNKRESNALRKKLNAAYDSFVDKYGYLNSPRNKKAINSFADRYAILSLENVQGEGKKMTVSKSDIFTKDTIAPNRTVQSAETVEEGLTVSMNTVGRVDTGMIARLTGQTAEAVQRQLIDQRLVFKDKDGNLIPAVQYLSGNVRAKLRLMEGLAGIDPDYRHNVEALREVVPPTVRHTDIHVNPGATWVPAQVYEDFVSHILDRYNHENWRTGKKDFSVTYVGETNEYKVEINDAHAKQGARNTQVWGESGKSFAQIFENMLNGRRTNVYMAGPDGKRVIDRVKTEAVSEKAEKLGEEFRKWLWEDETRRSEMEELYNESFNALVTPRYSGENLTVNGLNATYTLRPHQKDAVARIINSGGNTLLAHRVGAGKTMEMAAAAMKLKQLGVVKKPMFVVPNNVVAQWGKEFSDYFPAANILVVGDEDMTPAERMTTINKIKNNDYDAVILAYTKFEKIQMTAAWRQKFYEEQIDGLLFAINAEKESQGGKGFTVKQLENKRKQLEGRMKKLTEKAKDEDGAMFEDLGVDALFVDEAHNFKNLEYSTRMNNVSGLGKADGSQRAFDLYTKVRYLQQLNGGRGVVFATATPVMNSMTEMYIMQKYLQPDTLKQLGIEHFDSWAKMFGEVVNALEIAPSGNGYRVKQTFSKFKNVKALQQLFRSFTDVLTDVPGLKIPKMKGRKVQIVQCEQGEFQKNYMAELAERAENVRNVDPSEDNMLKITSDGRKISYSQRMIDPSMPYEEAGKIYKCCDNVAQVYRESASVKGTQMIFCDMATPKGKAAAKTEADTAYDEFAAVDTESAQLYDDMKARLVQLGIPEKEIAFIHDAKNDKQKAQLSERMNNGTIRVLIGSTGKMGVGLNAQKKAVAIHHLDAPWRPGDIEQRDGRVFRQKNANEEAYKFVYVTKGSFDSRLWDILERKQKFINQVMNGEDVGNEIEDTGEVTLSAAEVKAVASDNPLIMEQVALEKEITKLQSLQQAHRAGVAKAQEKMVTDRRNIANLENLIGSVKADLKTRVDTYSEKKFDLEIGGEVYRDKKDAGAALIAQAKAKAVEGQYTAIGSFAGFTMQVVKTKEGITGLLSGKGSYQFKTYPLNATYGINHLCSVAESLDERLSVWTKNLAEAKSDLEMQMQIAAEPFAQAEKLSQKRKRFNEVMDILNPPVEQHMEDGVQEQSRSYLSDEADVFRNDVDGWDKRGRPEGETFILGSTGDVLQGLGAIESDIYVQGDKLNTIFREHPEMSMKEIKNLPEILENPVLILASRNVNRGGMTNTRLAVFGMVKAKNGLPMLVALDLHPVENKLYLSDMQKVVSAYTKDRSPTATMKFMENSDVLYADKEKTASLLHTAGFQNAYRIEQSGYIGSIAYMDDEVKIVGKKFSDVVKRQGEQNQQRTDTLTDREVLEMAANEIQVDSLSDVEKSALAIFRERLGRLEDLQNKRIEEGRLYKEQQFGTRVDRDAAAATLNRMRTLDAQIQRASADVLDVEQKTVLREVLKKARRVVEKQQLSRDQQTLKRWRDRRNNADAIRKYRSRLSKDVQELTNWAIRPDNKNVVKHIPDALKQTVLPFLSSIDFTSKRGLSGKEATKADQEFVKRLRAIETIMEESDGTDDMYANYRDLPPDFLTRLHRFTSNTSELIESAGGGEFVVNRMTSDELKELSGIVRILKKYIMDMNRFHVNAMFQHVSEAGDNSIDFLGKLKPAQHTGTVSEFLKWQQMRPAYAFERFGEGGKAIYDGLRRGQATLAFDTKQIEAFAEKTYTTEEVRAWDKQLKTINLPSGGKVTMKVSQIMSLYELSKRKQALGHILGEGIRVATFTDKGNKISDVGRAVTDDDLMAIFGVLTDRQKQVADKLQRFMQEQGGAWGNHVTLARFGERQFGEENYFPINSDGRHLNVDADEKLGNASLYALLNMGFTKQTQENARNRIVVYSIFDVFANHMASMAQYHAFALPVVDALKWLNYKQTEIGEDGTKTLIGSVREEMDRAFGVPDETRPGKGKQGYAQNFVINIIKAFNGTAAQGTPYDGFGMQTLHRYNRAQVAYNFRVVVQQPMAITRAAQLIGYGSILKGLKLRPAVIQKNIEEMRKHSGIAAWKSLGFYDVNISRGLTAIIKHDENLMDKITDVGMKGAEMADTWAWAAMWAACKEEVISKRRLTPKSAGFYEAVTQLFEDVIYKTQVVDSVLTKNEFMRDKGFFARAVGSFMSEPTTTASMLIDAYDKFEMDMQRGMSRQQAWKRNSSNIVRTAYVYGIGALCLAAVQAVADGFRDDDDYQDFFEKWLEAFKGNLVDELMPLNKLPILDQFYEIAKELIAVGGIDIYGQLSNWPMAEIAEKLIKGVEIIHDHIEGADTSYTRYAGVYKILQAASGMFGVPMAAATREIVTAWNNTVGAMAPSLKVKTYDTGDKNEIQYAYQDGWLTEAEAADLLTSQELVDTEDEAYWTIRGWDAGEGYSKYDNLYAAALAGDDITDALEELTSHGVSKKDALSQLESQIGKWYYDEESEARITKDQTVEMLRKYCGMKPDEITETVNRWSSKVVTGIAWGDIQEEYLKGNITAQRAVEMYVRYGGYDKERAQVVVGKWRAEKETGIAYKDIDDAFLDGEITAGDVRNMYMTYGGLTQEEAEEKVAVLSFVKKNPALEGISYAAIQDYSEFCEPAGVKPKVFYDAWKYKNSIKSSGYGSVKEPMLEYINGLDLTVEQKDALYLAFGWAASKLRQTPWHK